MDNNTLISAGAGLLGALIGGGFSLLSAKIQLKAQYELIKDEKNRIEELRSEETESLQIYIDEFIKPEIKNTLRIITRYTNIETHGFKDLKDDYNVFGSNFARDRFTLLIENKISFKEFEFIKELLVKHREKEILKTYKLFKRIKTINEEDLSIKENREKFLDELKTFLEKYEINFKKDI